MFLFNFTFALSAFSNLHLAAPQNTKWALLKTWRALITSSYFIIKPIKKEGWLWLRRTERRRGCLVKSGLVKTHNNPWQILVYGTITYVITSRWIPAHPSHVAQMFRIDALQIKAPSSEQPVLTSTFDIVMNLLLLRMKYACMDTFLWCLSSLWLCINVKSHQNII